MDLAIDAMNPNILYAATRDGVYLSTNGAMNWVAINDGLPAFGRDVTFSHDRVLEIDAVGRSIYAAIRIGKDARSPRTIYKAIVKPDIPSNFKYAFGTGSDTWISNLESNSNISSVSYDKKINALEIGVSGPIGTDGYVKLELPRLVIGTEPVTGGSIESYECDPVECVVRYRHASELTIRLDLN